MKKNTFTNLHFLLLGLGLAWGSENASAQCMSVGTNLGSQNTWAPAGTVTFKEGLDDGKGEEWSNTTNPWAPTFLQDVNIATYQAIRFMDLGNTNWSTLENWEDRIKAQDNNYLGGVWGGKNLAYWWMVDLCNRTNKDMWINIPHRANDNFVRELAQLIKKDLKPGLQVYVEYSNEIWNPVFSTANGNGREGQWDYCRNRATALGLPGQNLDYKAAAFYTYRAVRIFKIFQDVFNAEPARQNLLRKVLAFSGNEDVARHGLAMLDNATVNPNNIRPTTFVVAPYIAIEDGQSAGAVQRFKDEVDAMVAPAQPTSPDGSKRLGGYVTRFKKVLNEFNNAHFYKLSFVTYEGGQHIFNGTSQAFAKNPGAYEAYQYMLNKFKPHFSLFMHFVHASKWDQYDAWGAKAYYGQPASEAPKFRALRDFAASNACGSAQVLSRPAPDEAAARFSLHPNPASLTQPQVVVDLADDKASATVEVVDLQGRVVLAKSVKSQEDAVLDLNGFATGLYMVRTTQGTNVSTQKLIVEK